MASFVKILRDALLNKKEVVLNTADAADTNDIVEAKFVKLDDEKYELTSESGFKYKEDDKELQYDIGTVYFCWLNKDSSTTEYIEKCERCHIKVISFMERTELVSYLSGDVETCQYLADSKTIEKDHTTGETALSHPHAAVPQSVQESKNDSMQGENNNKEETVQKGKDDKTVPKEKTNEKSKSRKNHEEVEKVDYKEIKRRKLEQDPILKCISVHEIELIDHDKSLRGTQKNNDFSNLIRECEYKIVRPLKLAGKSASGASKTKSTSLPSSSSSSFGGSKGKSSSRSKTNALAAADSANSLSTILRKKDPIIILSPSAISMLTMTNVKSFLQDGKFVDPQHANDQLNDSTTHGGSTNNSNSNMIQIVRQSKRFNKKIKFVVVSNVEKFFVKPEYWDRVVAVFTTGQEWQFKNYKVNQPNLLFQKVKGFYVNYNGDVVPNNVKNWNVQVISLDRNQRFKDRQISEFLWESIERFMLARGYK